MLPQYYWWILTAVTAPLLVVVLVGLMICRKQRFQKPKVAKLMAYALLITFAWRALINPALVAWIAAMELRFQDVPQLFISDMVAILVWSLALWAVLGVDQKNGTSSEE